jgi:uncharacterized protein (TIGR03435 family)
VRKPRSQPFVLTTVAIVAALGVFSTAAQEPAPPTFRAGVRLVEVDAVVQDKDEHFIDSLTKDDFEILEDGASRPIQQLWTVNIPTDRKVVSTASATPLALVGNEGVDVGRLYVLVLSDGTPAAVRKIARQFITEFLGPTDLMAVVHVANGAATQGLTANRELLLASVDRYRGVNTDTQYEASLGVLKDVAVSLSASTGRRKSVLFIGHGFKLWTPLVTPGSALSGQQIQEGIDARKRSRVFDDLEKAAKRNNVRIYPVDPDGFQPGAPGVSDLAAGGMKGDKVASLRVLAADTGGREIANTNNYAANFARVVRDNSAYYLLTYESAADADGQPHPITVRLRNRPDLSVHQGRLSVIAPAPDVKGRGVGLPRDLSAEARSLLTSCRDCVSSTTLRNEASQLDLFTAVFEGANFNGSILIGTHVPGTSLRLGPKETIELSYVAIDRWGTVRAAERRAFTLNLSADSRARAEQTGVRLLSRLQVPRGQYQIRVTAHQPNGLTAAAGADVDVPDYTEQSLTVSDFVVASSQAAPLLTLQEDALLRNALPAQPTPARRFARNDTLAVFAEIADSHWVLSQEVGVTMTVIAGDGRAVYRGEQVLTAANKGRFTLKGSLPLNIFSPGDYQLLVEVYTRRGIPANTSRQMRFTVVEAMAPTTVKPSQRAERDTRHFDVVSVRRSSTPKPQPGAAAPRGSLRVLPDGRFEARGETVADLARVAFGFDNVDPRNGVVEAAGWMWSDRFDVTASVNQPWTSPPPGTTVPAELRTMLRAMLEDRFALQTRMAATKVDATALRLATPGTVGPTLRSSSVAEECRGAVIDPSSKRTSGAPGCLPASPDPRTLEATGVTMADVALIFSLNPMYGSRGPYVDQTGLTGLYDLSFPLHGGNVGILFAEFEKQLGVKLIKTTVERPALIIESAKKPQED